MSFRATVALLGNVTETSGIPSLETMTWVRYPQVLSLGVVIYLLGVHGALCSMDITEPDTGWKWSSVAHIHPGSVFKLSEARPDGNEKKAGIVSIACEVTAQVAKKNDPAGYVEIIGKINEPLDLTQYQALSFAYRFSKILPDKSIRSMWIYLGGGTKERIEVIADGQWHEVVIPLYEFITNPRDTILEKATGIAFCYYVRPTEENQEVKFTFWLDDVKLEEKSQGKQKPAILCLTPSTKETYGRRAVEFISEPVEKELKNRGFERGWHVGWDDLCMNYLKAFNAVIFYDYPFLTPGEAIPPEVRKQIELFQKYVKEGGSLFFASSPYTQAKIIVMNELMKPMNGKVYAELVKDESNVYKLSYPCPFITFSWTDAITRSPLTEGVTGLYYGTTFLEPGSPTTLPAEVGNEWQILARGLPSTSSFKVDPSANSVSGKGTFAESPVLVAVREYGKGRIVLWPMSLTFTMMDGYSWMLENGIVMDGKANGRISNGGRLLYNLLQWLVEPSMPEKNFGGYKQPEETSLSKKKAKHKAIKWSKPRGEVINPIYQHAYLGLAGAMSHLSSGKSSPEEMIKAAKTAGYRFVVFTEDVETLSRDSWDKLIAVCKQNSDTNFYAFPGFYYKTQWGAEYITFGGHADLCYPLPEWVVEVDGKRRIKENNCFVRGLKETPPVVMVYPGRNPRPLRVNAQFYGFSTHTYEGGKLMDEAVSSYLKLQREGLLLFPMAVHFVKNTEEIKDARSEGLQSYIRANALEGVLRSVQGMARSLNNPGWCKPAFVSSGPEIQYLHAMNWGTTDLAIPGADRHRLQVKVRSKVGLKEIIIYDKAELFRRFLPGGTKEFSGQIDIFHDKQHSYVVQATDINGGVAISWSRTTDMSECSFGMCGDNWNDMPTGKYGGSVSGLGGHLRGTEFRAPPSSHVWVWPYLVNYRAGGLACLKESGIVTRFGWIVDYSMDHVYQESGQPGIAYDRHKVIPNPFFKGKIRSYFSTGRNPKPNFGMNEGVIAFTQNIVMKGIPGLSASCIYSEHVKGYFIYPDANGKKEIHDKSKKHETVEGMLMPDDYVAFFSPVNGVFNLGAKPLVWSVWNALPGRLFVGLGRSKDTFKKDDTLNWRIFGVSGGKESDQRFLDDIRKKMGLTGPPAYRVIPKTGKVVGTRLYLNLAAERYGFRGKITHADLPLVLTGFISGLNPRWSAGIWYKGENILKVIEYYHNVVDRPCTNEIIRIGVLDETGYFQVDIEEKDRDVYIGNLVTADNPDLFLSLFQDEDGVYVIAHNPTDNEISAVIRPGTGFDLYGSFRKKVVVKPGSSMTIDLPAERQGLDRNQWFIILVVGVVLCMAILFFIVKKRGGTTYNPNGGKNT